MPNEHLWHAPPGGDLSVQSLGKLQQAVNYPKGLHGDSFDHDLTLPATGPGSRMMLIGPQIIPVSVTVTLKPGSVMKII